MDSAESHQAFIKKHNLKDITLLSDKDGIVTNSFSAKHWLLPVAKRSYFVVDKKRTIIFKEDSSMISVLKNQTETLCKIIDTSL